MKRALSDPRLGIALCALSFVLSALATWRTHENNKQAERIMQQTVCDFCRSSLWVSYEDGGGGPPRPGDCADECEGLQ